MFAVAEMIVRFTVGDATVLFPRYHTEAQYGDFAIRTIRPNSEFRHTSVDGSWMFRTNAKGFRNDVDFAYEKPPGTIRVLSLGDSHTQGYEVRQNATFSAVIEKALARQGKVSEVMNAGVSGFSTAEALVLLENEGVKYQPDAVVLGFYKNDIEDNIKAGLFKLDEKGSLFVARHSHIPGVAIQDVIYSIPGVKSLGENSYFYSLLFNTTWELFKEKLRSTSIEQTREYAVAKRTVHSSYELELARALLIRMSEFCVANDIELVVLDIPVVGNGSTFESSLSQDIRQTLEARNIPFIDSERTFVDYDGVAELHVPNGHRHISEFTHLMLGIAAAEQLAKLVADAK